MVFIITEEERPITKELTLIIGKKIIRVYRAENDRELRQFINGVLCTKISGVWEVVEEIKNRLRI